MSDVLKSLALLFPGQGSQYIGMGKRLYEQFPAAREVFAEANDVLGYDIKKLCFTGEMTELTRTENAQPAILAVSAAAFKVYMQEFGIQPECAAGHSLGEFSALTCTGAVAFPDALHLVRKRGLFMQEAAVRGEGAMIAVSGLDTQIVENECKKINTPRHPLVISSYNAPLQVVISGRTPAVLKAAKNLKEKGAKIVPLEVSAPFHSPLMEFAAKKLNEELKKYTFNPLKWDIVSNVTALPYKGKNEIVENLTAQMKEPVRWHETMGYLEKRGIKIVLEMGPKTVLRNLTTKNKMTARAFSFDIEEDIHVFSEVIKKRLTTCIDRTLASAVAIKNRNWNNREYQEGVVEPYIKVKQMSLHLEKEGNFPTIKQLNMAVDMLKSVLKTKKVPPREQEERLKQIYE